MQTRVSVDIETFSSVDLKTCGLYKYVESPDFEVLLIAYAVNDSPVQIIDVAGEEYSGDFLRLMDDPAVLIYAFNAQFEWQGLSKWLQQIGRPPLDIRRMRCTMAQAWYCGYSGGLAAVGESLMLPQDKRKMGIGGKLIRTFCVPQKPTRTNGSRTRTLPHHEPEQWQLFKQYCLQDVATEREIQHCLNPWPLPAREQALWAQDCLINARGVRVDLRLVEGAMRIAAQVEADLMDEAREISGLANPKSVAQLTRWISQELGEDEDLPDLRKETVNRLLADGLDSGAAERMLRIRQQLGKASTKKYDAMAATADVSGIVRGLMQYYGASRTGRWAGRLVQVQNLPRNNLDSIGFARDTVCRRDDLALPLLRFMYDNIPDVLSQLIRTAFIPRLEHIYLIADYSAIEARVLAWLAGEQWVMDVFAGHGKIYEATAAQMFRVPIEKIAKGQPEYELRQKGKVATLALGYAGGTGALIAMGALRMGLEEDELPDIVDLWRRSNPNIVAFWKDYEMATLECLRTGEPRGLRGLTIRQEGAQASGQHFLTVELPAGRKLFYPRPFIGPGKFDRPCMKFMNSGKAEDTFGGKLTENAVQAIARDCLAELLLRLEERGLAVVFHVHDEVIVECPEDRLDEILGLMAAPIAWAPGLVLKGDGFSTTDYYMKG